MKASMPDKDTFSHIYMKASQYHSEDAQGSKKKEEAVQHSVTPQGLWIQHQEVSYAEYCKSTKDMAH